MHLNKVLGRLGPRRQYYIANLLAILALAKVIIVNVPALRYLSALHFKVYLSISGR